MKLFSQTIGIVLIALTSLAHADSATDVTAAAIEQMLEQAQELRLQGKYDDGISLARAAQAEAGKLSNPNLEVEAIFQLSLLYYYQQDYPHARAEMQMGLARARVQELDNLEADFLAAEGVLEWKQGNLHLALPKLQQAMAIRENRDDFISMASISNNIGIIYYTLKNYEDAEFYYRKGLDLLKSGDNERLRSSLYSNLAEILIPMDRLEEAESYLMQALEIDQQTSEPQSLAYTYYNLGELASRRGESAKALNYYQAALELQTSINDKWAIALTRLKRADEFFKNGEVDASLDETLTGYKLAKELNALSLLRDYSAHFIKVYEELGQTGKTKFYVDQHEWLVNRVQLEESGPKVIEPVTPIAEPEVEDINISPIQTLIIVLLAALILILIVENSRLRNRLTDM